MDDAKPGYIKRFIAADLPDADETVVGIMAVVAREREKIAQRTREALAVARRRLARDGRASGNPNGAAAARRARQGDKVAIAAVVLGTSQRTGAIPERIRRHDASPDLLEAIGAAVLADGRLGVPQKNI